MARIVIDLNKWQTMSQYATENAIPLGTLGARIQRKRKGKASGECPLFKDYPQLNLTLVRKKEK